MRTMRKLHCITFFSSLCLASGAFSQIQIGYPSQKFGLHITTPGTQFDPAMPTGGQTWSKVDAMLRLPEIYRKQVWLRSGLPLWEIYRAPNGEETTADPLFNEDGFNAELSILGRCFTHGYNWLCPLIPGYPSKSGDGFDPAFWNNLYRDQAHTQPVTGEELNKLRDTYRIPDLFYYLPRSTFAMRGGGVNALTDSGRQIESIVRKINSIAFYDFGWANYQDKISYQLGNEPCGGEAVRDGSFGALHPGGSQAAAATIGGWDGLGANYEKIFANVNFGTKPGSPQCQLVGPALSLVSHGEGFADGFLGNRYGLQSYWGGGTPFSATFSELVSANKELTDKTWAGRLNHRSVHFRCPQVMWEDTDPGGIFYLNFDNSPHYVNATAPHGRWERPGHYAARIRDILADLVGYIQIAPMGKVSSSLPVDVTEFYFTNASLRAQSITSELGGVSASGTVDMDILRSLSFTDSNGPLSPKRLDPNMPSRWAYLRAIRDEIINRPIPNLNRIYWFEMEKYFITNPTYSRFDDGTPSHSNTLQKLWYNTGLSNPDFGTKIHSPSDPLIGVTYNPYTDYMLSDRDINAIFGP